MISLSFLKNKKPIIVNAYTYNGGVYANAKIQKSSAFRPRFIDELPSYKNSKAPFDGSANNMRGCTGFLKYYQNGFIIPMWTDLAIRVSKDWFSVDAIDNKTDCVVHNSDQRGGYAPDSEYQHLKISSPWLIECEDDIDWVWTDPVWSRDDIAAYSTLPGVVNFSNVNTCNINMLVKKDDGVKDVLIPFMQPMVSLFPMSERKVIVKCHLIPPHEWKQMHERNEPVAFLNSSTKAIKARKRCPFSF